MSEHTQGRLWTDEAEHDAPYQNIEIKAGAHHTVATVWIDDAPVEDYNAAQRANARRLVACWNVCEGIGTNELEASGGAAVAWMRCASKLIRTTRQRDELLDALKWVVEYLDHAPKQLTELHKWVGIAREAIAKATGGN